jgi:AcrR family transcriptional regulator
MTEKLRRRRGFDEMHHALLNAAVDVFALRGYSGATTSEIARRAATSEALLFRHFRSKADLFEAAVVAPFASFVARYADSWARREDPHSPELMAYEFVTWTFCKLREHRTLALALLGSVLHDNGIDDHRDTFKQLIADCMAVLDHEAMSSGWADVDVAVTTRIILSGLMSAALFKEFMFESPEEVDDQLILDQYVAFVLHGIQRAEKPARHSVAITEDRARHRLVISSNDQHSSLSAASDWVARHDARIEAMSWHGDELRIFYSR